MDRRSLLLSGAGLLLGQQNTASEARDYDKFSSRFTKPLAAELIKFAALPDTGKLLDYGCATGALALRLAVKYPAAEIIGVDVSEAMISYATVQAPRAKVRFQSTPDLMRLPFTLGTFDGALSVNTISQIADPARALAEIRRVTKPEAVIAAAVWDYGTSMQPLQFFWDAAVAANPSLTPGDGPKVPFSKKGQLEELWKASKLSDVVEQPLEVELAFRSFEEYWSPFLLGQGTSGAWLQTQSPEQRNAVRERLRARTLGSRADNGFFWRAKAWAVRGVVRMGD